MVVAQIFKCSVWYPIMGQGQAVVQPLSAGSKSRTLLIASIISCWARAVERPMSLSLEGRRYAVSFRGIKFPWLLAPISKSPKRGNTHGVSSLAKAGIVCETLSWINNHQTIFHTGFEFATIFTDYLVKRKERCDSRTNGRRYYRTYRRRSM